MLVAHVNVIVSDSESYTEDRAGQYEARAASYLNFSMDK